MKKLLLIVSGLSFLFSCGGGGGGGSVQYSSSKSYPLASFPNDTSSEKSSTEVTRVVKDVTTLSEDSVRANSEKASLIKQILNRTFFQNKRAIEDYGVPVVPFSCDYGYSGYLPVKIEYKNPNGEKVCSNIKSLTIYLNANPNVVLPESTSSDYISTCLLGDTLISSSIAPFFMIIKATDFQDNCLPQKIGVSVNGTISVIDTSKPIEQPINPSVIKETYNFSNFNVNYDSISWGSNDILGANFSIIGSFSYFSPNINNYYTAISYTTDISGNTSSTGDTYHGWIKLGCIDNWFKIDTESPIKYSASDEPIDGKFLITAKNGEISISYTSSGIDITETIDNRTNTYHYNNIDELENEINGTVCVAQ